MSGASDRGQVHTLEAVTAVFIMFGGVVFALQVTAVTPLTASTASQHIENQQQGIAAGLLDAAAENGTLQSTLLYWNDTGSKFHRSNDDGEYTSGAPPTVFGAQLNETFLEQGIAFDMSIHYVTRTGSDSLARKSVQVVNLGVPSDNAVSASRTVTIYDDDVVFDASESATATAVTSANPLNIKEDHAPNSPIWNVFEVEVTLWRM